ncbi:hypothetical protein FNF27_05386 [Cafeteria roenbergensis]|uniref:Uncharacterized protein n=1 Tax=Cafeteria roenbergensis TaxID=33653 RepID=A0A5A8E615_CAFRO|nr:hypothetical protein FNF27_05386 [Cafeteria roenbergensis]
MAAARLRDRFSEACGAKPDVIQEAIAVIDFIGAPPAAGALAVSLLAKLHGSMTYRDLVALKLPEWCACLAAEVVAQRCRNAASLSLRTYGPRALRDLSRVPGGLDEWYALVDPAMAAASIHDWGVVAARQEARKRREAERRAISKFLAPRRDEAATAEAGDAAASAAAEAEAAPEGEARPDGHEAASGGAAGEWPGGLQQVAAAEAVAAAGSLGGGEDASDPGGRRADEPSASEGSDGDATPSPTVALFAAFRRWLWLLAGAEIEAQEAPEPKAGKAIIETPPGPPALLRSASPAEMILNHIPQMAAVTALDLSFASGCGDAEFAALAALPRLASLEVNGWQALSAEGIVKFVANSRRSTILPAQQPLLSKRDASHGAAARSLVGQAALRAPPLRSLSLGDCRRIDDAALFAIGRGLQGVEDLCLFGCSMVTDHAAASFSGSSSRLRRLCVAGAYKFGRDATRFLLTSVNPHMIVYVNPAEFSRCAFDQGPSTEEAFPAGEAPGGSCDPEEPLEESLLRPATPARSTYSRPRVTSTLPAVEPRRCSCRNTDD